MKKFFNKIWEFIKSIFRKKKSEVIPPPTFNPINDFENWSQIEKDITKLINIHRYNNSNFLKKILVSLKVSKELIPDKIVRRKAQQRVEYQFDKEKITHEGFYTVVNSLKYIGYKKVAEILAYGYSSPEAVVMAWINSNKGHNEIMLMTEWKYIGVSHQVGVNGKNYYCVLFAN